MTEAAVSETNVDAEPFRVVSDFAPAGDQPEAIEALAEGIEARRAVPDAARHHRLGQVGHDRVDDRAGAAADADPRAQQEPRRPARPGDARVLPEQPGRVLRQLLRLLPARGVHPVERHLHREGLARSTTRSTGCATRPPPALLTRRDVIVVASVQLHLRHGQPRGVPGSTARPQRRRRLRHAQRSCAGWSTCSTTATT